LTGGSYPTTAYSYLLSDVHNVHQALAWADANARGRRYIVYAVVDCGGENGLLQLRGDEPNRSDDPHRAAPDELNARPVQPLSRPGHSPPRVRPSRAALAERK